MENKIYCGLSNVWCKYQTEPFMEEYISVSFIKQFLDSELFNNSNVWNDDEYLKENYPAQYLLKNLLK